MRIPINLTPLLAIASALYQSNLCNSFIVRRSNTLNRVAKYTNKLSAVSSSRSIEDCSCKTITSGKLSDKALSLNPQKVLTSNDCSVYNISGEKVLMKSLLESSPSGVSIVVFLRSFG